jgi:hypothetical protein
MSNLYYGNNHEIYISMKFAVDVAIIDMLAFAHGQAQISYYLPFDE